MRRGFKAWTEKESTLVRVKMGLLAHSPLEARKLGKHLGIRILAPEELGLSSEVLEELLSKNSSKWSAATIYVKSVPLIILNSAHSPVRQESDLMHEFAHILCEHPPQKIASGGAFPFPVREYNRDQEEEADWFGAVLKIPRQALLKAVQQGMSDEALAGAFFCSVQLARMRKNRSGVLLQMRRRKNLVGVHSR